MCNSVEKGSRLDFLFSLFENEHFRRVKLLQLHLIVPEERRSSEYESDGPGNFSHHF